MVGKVIYSNKLDSANMVQRVIIIHLPPSLRYESLRVIVQYEHHSVFVWFSLFQNT